MVRIVITLTIGNIIMRKSTALAWITSTLLVLSVANVLSNTQCRHKGPPHPVRVDPSIPHLPPKVTYYKDTNTLIIDDAQHWQLQSQSSDVKLLNWILKIVTLGYSWLEYAPYSHFHSLLRDQDLRNAVLIIEVNQRDFYVISVGMYKVGGRDLGKHLDPTQRQWESSVYNKHYKSFYTDSFYRVNEGDVSGHINCFGNHEASPAEIVSVAIIQSTFAVWSVSMIILLANNIQHLHF